MKHLRNSLLTVALAFMTLGYIPSFSMPVVGKIQGLGQVAHASTTDAGFWECWRNPPPLRGFWKSVLCRSLSVGTFATGLAGLIKNVTSTLAKYGLKAGVKALKKLQPVTFKIPHRILFWEIPKPPKGPAGLSWTFDPTLLAAYLEAGTKSLLWTFLTATTYEFVDRCCKCWLKETSTDD